MATVEDDIVAAGAEIIWVLEAAPNGLPGTADLCMSFMDNFDSTQGWCVGDAQTEPEPGVWDDSPFAQGRGFDIVTPRSTMRIEYVTTHGTPGGNENLSGQEVLEAVQAVIDGL